MKYWFTWILCTTSFPFWAQMDTGAYKGNNYSLHFQSAFIPQYHFDFPPYNGANSLMPSEVVRASVSATAYCCFPATRFYIKAQK